MESAFGVEHGEISKGLPSALKDATKTPGFSRYSPPANSKSLSDQVLRQRQDAHILGSAAARWKASPGGSPQGSGLNTVSGAITTGRKSKAKYHQLSELKRLDDTAVPGRKKRKALP